MCIKSIGNLSTITNVLDAFEESRAARKSPTRVRRVETEDEHQGSSIHMDLGTTHQRVLH